MASIYSKSSGLINRFFLFKKFPVLKQVIKFGIVGISNIAIDVLVYWLFTRFFHLYYILAATVSFLVANVWSYFWNRRWTFHDDNRAVIRQYFKFLAANIIAIILNLGVLFVLVDFLHLNDITAKIIASIIVGLINFAINKKWAFGGKPEKSQEAV